MTKEQAKEANENLSEILSELQDVLLTSDAEQTSHLLTYSKEDLFNVMYMFQHIAMNVGIKNGTINMDNATGMGEKVRETVKLMTGYDSVELTKEVFKIKDENVKQKQSLT